MISKFLMLLLFTAAPSSAWWCEGHAVVALIAENHLGPDAKAMVFELLKDHPVEATHFCKDIPDDAMAVASTWADDVKRSEKTGSWHYMDIPLGLKKGNPEDYCEPIGPSTNGADRPGCILTALRSMVNILHSKDEPDEEKAKALRYLIHLVGDLHQPMHTTSNNDQGGNCTPVQFFDDPKIANLHSVWDGMVFNRDMAAKKLTIAQFAGQIDEAHLAKRTAWIKSSPEFDKWAWEGHLMAQKFAYGDLDPKPPIEAYIKRPDCKVETEHFAVLHIKAADAYETATAPEIEEQLAKAGYRLAEVLNTLFP